MLEVIKKTWVINSAKLILKDDKADPKAKAARKARRKNRK